MIGARLVLVNTPNGLAPPLVTGTFGSADFLHSLLGEASECVFTTNVYVLNTYSSGSYI